MAPTRHPIIVLWCHPRSGSSAFERAMLERGDLHTFHEPFLYLYYVHEARRVLPHFEPDPEHPTDYAGIKAMILARASAGPVFVKDMAYYALNHLADDPDFMRRTVNTFLIRDPAKAISSYHRLDPDLTVEEVGLEAQYRHFERIRALVGHCPPVVDADDLARDTTGVMRAYSEAVGLPFLPDSLEWTPALPRAWQFVGRWHRDVARSGGLGKSQRASTPPDLDAAPQLRALHRHHLPFYQALHAHRLRA